MYEAEMKLSTDFIVINFAKPCRVKITMPIPPCNLTTCVHTALAALWGHLEESLKCNVIWGGIIFTITQIYRTYVGI